MYEVTPCIEIIIFMLAGVPLSIITVGFIEWKTK